VTQFEAASQLVAKSDYTKSTNTNSQLPRIDIAILVSWKLTFASLSPSRTGPAHLLWTGTQPKRWNSLPTADPNSHWLAAALIATT